MDELIKTVQIKAATILSNICARIPCNECQFYSEDLKCMLINEVPEAWADTIEGETDDESDAG